MKAKSVKTLVNTVSFLSLWCVLLILLAVTIWIVPWGIWEIRLASFVACLAFYRVVGASLAYHRARAGAISTVFTLLGIDLVMVFATLSILFPLLPDSSFDAQGETRLVFRLVLTGAMGLVAVQYMLNRRLREDIQALEKLSSQQISLWEVPFLAFFLLAVKMRGPNIEESEKGGRNGLQ